MTEERDVILRNIKYLSDFLLLLMKQKPIERKKIFLQLDEFLLNRNNIVLKSLLEKTIIEIIENIAKNNLNNIKDFADILYIKYSLETCFLEKERLSKIIIELYDFYQTSTGIYIYDIESKITGMKFIKNKTIQ